MSALPVNWTWNDLPPSFSASLCHVLLHLLRVPWAPEFLFKSISFPFLFSLSSVLKLSHLTRAGRNLSPHSISMLFSYLCLLPLFPLLSSPSFFFPANIKIVYASDKKMPLILRFVGEQTDAIGHLLFCVEFSMWGVCGIHGNKVGCTYPPCHRAEWEGRGWKEAIK